jgi:hypothetical protein
VWPRFVRTLEMLSRFPFHRSLDGGLNPYVGIESKHGLSGNLLPLCPRWTRWKKMSMLK